MSGNEPADVLMERANFSEEQRHKYRDLLYWLDQELIVANIGTIDSFDDARSALHALCVWYQDLGKYHQEQKSYEAELEEPREESPEHDDLSDRYKELSDLVRDYIGTKPAYQYGLSENCLHKKCPSCGGSGINKYTGHYCVHMISCPCPSCSIWS